MLASLAPSTGDSGYEILGFCRRPRIGMELFRPQKLDLSLLMVEPFQHQLDCARSVSENVDQAALLRRHGVQVTAQRMAVLQAVSERPQGTAADIDAAVRSRIGAISLQAVYDALGILAEKGIVRRIQPVRSPARYEDRVGDNHHDLICRACGRMVDVDCAVGVAPCLTAVEDSRYEIDEADVIYWGRRPDRRVASPDNHENAPASK